MVLVADILRTSAISEELSDIEAETINGLLDIQDYQSGSVISQSENMSILTLGNIKVKAQNSVGVSTIRILKPGDILGLGYPAGLRAIDNGTASQTFTILYALGDTQVLSLDKAKFESLVKFPPEILYHVIQGLIRSGHGLLQSMHSQYIELRNYFYGVNCQRALLEISLLLTQRLNIKRSVPAHFKQPTRC